MSTPRYFSLIQIVEMGQTKQGLDTKAVETIYTDKKIFTIGSGSGADFRFKGPGVDSVHLAVKLDGHNLFIKSLEQSQTQVSSYKIPPEKVVPYKSGEAIRLGTAKQIIFIHLFRRFVEPHEESEAIVREAWEKAKEAEEAAANHLRTLALQQKQAESFKSEAAKKASEIVEQGKDEAERHRKAAVQSEGQILEKAEQQAAQKIQDAQKEADRILQEIELKNEENIRKVMDQAREKAKEIKAEAERESEAILKSAQREAEMLTSNGKKALSTLQEQSENEKQRLIDEKNRVREEITATEKSRQEVLQALSAASSELKGIEGLKAEAQNEFEQEKQKLKLNMEDLEKKVDLLQRDKRALDSELADGSAYLKDVKAKAEAAIKDAEQAKSAEGSAKQELRQHEEKIKVVRAELEKVESEHAKVVSHLNTLITREAQEMEKLRDKLNMEYEKRKKFEQDWFAQERVKEQQQADKERVAQMIIEGQRLADQAKAISSKIVPLISLELETKMSAEDVNAFLPQLEKIIDPLVQRAVEEEYSFRRGNWSKVPLRRPSIRKMNVGLAALAFIFMVVAVVASVKLGRGGLLESQTESASQKQQ